MNTMADGAAQRQVAQIGEALFGQPGLTLMELAEKVKGMRSPFLMEQEPLPVDMRLGSADYLDYLNDQPSPGGQDAQRIVVRVPGVGQCTLAVNDGAIEIPAETIAALSAHQPVGEPVAYVEFLDRQNDSLRRAIHAIMAKLAFLLDEDQFADVDAIALAAGVAPPAQTVDLGQFRELASEMDRFRTKWKTVSIAEFNHYADRLLALPDSKAVGK